MSTLGDLVALLRGRRVVALTGAGCSTESGIPDYRGPDTPPRARPPIQHREFVDHASARRRYWARSVLGWPRLAAAEPNAGHRALARLEEANVIAGVITQNVDGLHGRAGSRDVVELHGALARVRCLTCGEVTSRDELQQRLLAANPQWPERARSIAIAPDGDADLADELVADFAVVACTAATASATAREPAVAACGGTLMPDVVFFGGSVPRPTLDAAWATFERAEVLLVVGSSLTVFSGYRFARRAAERGIPVAIVNRGTTRADDIAQLRVDARAGETLSAVAANLASRQGRME
ncbi:MAG TPA: NAD-dependent protein deacetylase [Xanthomonadales bacterium]|nr:NAD-dependent protein deacetylase [Xanthomonadales bacterium]